jgi:hypothetical protein
MGQSQTCPLASQLSGAADSARSQERGLVTDSGRARLGQQEGRGEVARESGHLLAFPAAMGLMYFKQGS